MSTTQQLPNHVLAASILRKLASILFSAWKDQDAEPDPADAYMRHWMSLHETAKWIEDNRSLDMPVQVREIMIGGLRAAHECWHEATPFRMSLKDCGCDVSKLIIQLAHLQILEATGVNCAA